MGSIRLEDLAEFLDDYLEIAEVADFPGAMNGLQVEGPEEVTKIAAAVDACDATIRAAAAARADLLLVHHGLFWAAPFRMTGHHYRRFAGLVTHRIAVYSAHLPLDVHPEVGNNAVLARAVGMEVDGEFSEYQGRAIARFGRWSGGREDLVARIAGELGCAPRLLPFGPPEVTRLGILTGAGGDAVREASEIGLDTLVTGEVSHPIFFEAEERGLNLILAGHYATETVGVRALAEHLGTKYALETLFLDHPTGL